MADDLAALLAAWRIGGPTVICGLSMGGYVAFQFQRAFPERTAALILCDTRSVADAPEAVRGRLETAARWSARGRSSSPTRCSPKLLSPSTLQQRPELVQSLRQRIVAAPAEGLAAALRGMAERPDATAWLPQIGCPTLVIVGQDDPLSTPAEMARLAAAIPQARLVGIAGAGHLAPLEPPDEVNHAILRAFPQGNWNSDWLLTIA